MAQGSERIKITDYNYLNFSWEQVEMDAVRNQSKVNIKIELVANTHGGIISNNNKRLQVYINGANVAWESVSIGINENSRKTLYQDTLTFTHNPDGSYAFAWTVKQQIDIVWNETTQIGEVTGSGTATLDPIAVPATITGTTEFTDENNPTILYSNPSGERIQQLRACIIYKKFISPGFYRDTELVEYRILPKDINGSYTFEITDDEKAAIIEATKTVKSLEVVFVLESTVADDIVHTSQAKRVLTMVNAEPDVVGVINDDAGYAIIRDHDPVTVKCIATPKKGASIVSYRITNGGQEITSSEGQFANISSDTFHFTVVDSRGYSVTVTSTIDVVPYIGLTCNIEVENSEMLSITNGSGTKIDAVTSTFTISGKLYTGTMMDGGSNNALTLTFGDGNVIRTIGSTMQTHTDSVSGTITEWGNLVIDTEKNYYTATVKITQSTSFQAQIVVSASDFIKDVEAECTAPEVIPIFDWSSKDFNFNVPVTIQGGEVPTILDSGSFTHTPNGTFYWRKWTDGTSELWGQTSFSCTFNTQWGVLYTSGAQSTTNISFPNGLFNDTPAIVAQLRTRSTGAFLMVPGGNTATSSNNTQTGVYELVRPAAYGTNSAFTICYNVKGRWK